MVAPTIRVMIKNQVVKKRRGGHCPPEIERIYVVAIIKKAGDRWSPLRCVMI